MKYGYPHNIYVLPFDHRASFSKGLFGEEVPAPETIEKIKLYKKLIYKAIFRTQEMLGLPNESLCVLVDEIYGDDILKDAVSKGIATMQTIEKSGQEEFALEFGEDFRKHLLEDKATFAKALIRYNPEGDKEMNARQVKKLKQVSDFCHSNGIKFLIEPLVPATKEQLEEEGGDKHRYDTELRADLVVKMISEIQEAGVECDVWKIEGFEKTSDYKKVVAQARNTEDRAQVGIIILGRGETKEMVEKWIEAGKGVKGVIGFAVGRTVFWEPLLALSKSETTEEGAVEAIANGFAHFCTVFATK